MGYGKEERGVITITEAAKRLFFEINPAGGSDGEVIR
jgi:hypothetical protein